MRSFNTFCVGVFFGTPSIVLALVFWSHCNLLKHFMVSGSVISVSDDRYLDHCDEAGLSKVRIPRMPKLRLRRGVCVQRQITINEG